MTLLDLVIQCPMVLVSESGPPPPPPRLDCICQLLLFYFIGRSFTNARKPKTCCAQCQLLTSPKTLYRGKSQARALTDNSSLFWKIKIKNHNCCTSKSRVLWTQDQQSWTVFLSVTLSQPVHVGNELFFPPISRLNVAQQNILEISDSLPLKRVKTCKEQPFSHKS